jgi:hypothetical protein
MPDWLLVRDATERSGVALLVAVKVRSRLETTATEN